MAIAFSNAYMHKFRIERIQAAARENHGLERMDQIKFAVLETQGGISIIPSEAKD